MGYSLRTWDYRYTLWLGFNPKTFQVGDHKLVPHNGRLPFISIGLFILPRVSALGSAWELNVMDASILSHNMLETERSRLNLSVSSIPLSIQVNVSDVHAGELYMSADDPGQDKNIFNNSDYSEIMRKTASLPQVSWNSFYRLFSS